MRDIKIIQLVPCVRPLYARFATINHDGEPDVIESRIDFLGLADDGEIYPMDASYSRHFDGFFPADSASNFIGLYCRPCQEEEEED